MLQEVSLGSRALNGWGIINRQLHYCQVVTYRRRNENAVRMVNFFFVLIWRPEMIIIGMANMHTSVKRSKAWTTRQWVNLNRFSKFIHSEDVLLTREGHFVCMNIHGCERSQRRAMTKMDITPSRAEPPKKDMVISLCRGFGDSRRYKNPIDAFVIHSAST